MNVVKKVLNPCIIAIQKRPRSFIIVVHRDKLRPCKAREPGEKKAIGAAGGPDRKRRGRKPNEPVAMAFCNRVLGKDIRTM